MPGQIWKQPRPSPDKRRWGTVGPRASRPKGRNRSPVAAQPPDGPAFQASDPEWPEMDDHSPSPEQIFLWPAPPAGRDTRPCQAFSPLARPSVCV